MDTELRRRLIAEIGTIEGETRELLEAALEEGDEGAASDFALVLARCVEARTTITLLLIPDDEATASGLVGH
jgi:hypothetical protein